MEKKKKLMTEITTKDEKYNAYEVILKCKALANDISHEDLLNLDSDTYNRIMILIEYLISLELQIIEFEPTVAEA